MGIVDWFYKRVSCPRQFFGSLIAVLGTIILVSPCVKPLNFFYTQVVPEFHNLSIGVKALTDFQVDLEDPNLHQPDTSLEKGRPGFDEVLNILEQISPKKIQKSQIVSITNSKRGTYKQVSGESLDVLNIIHVNTSSEDPSYKIICTETELIEKIEAHKNIRLYWVGTVLVVVGTLWQFIWQIFILIAYSMRKSGFPEKKLLNMSSMERIKDAINTRLEALERVTKCECISMDVFTLGFCYLDMMAGFYGGKSTPKERGDGIRFKAFIKDFLEPINKEYKPDRMYYDLRCGLVHSAAPHGGIIFTHKEKKIAHLTRVNKVGNLYSVHFHLPSFIKDLRVATEQYFNRLENEIELQNRAVKRERGLGLLAARKPIQL